MENAVRFSPNAFFADDNGYFYLWYKLDIPLKEFYEDAEDDVYTEADRIYVKDSQMNTLFYEQVPYSNGCQLLDFSLGEGIERRHPRKNISLGCLPQVLML